MCDHMFDEHGFSVGLPDNLVHLPRLLEILKIKLDHLQCFYCEHIFKSAKVLKEHMRKKKHWRIPQQRPLYDQFYLINYSHDVLNDKDEENDIVEEFDDENEEWQDWNEDDPSADLALCIYCESALPTPDACFDHMAQVHQWPFRNTKHDRHLSPYQCISWINHARKCVSENLCIVCQLKCGSKEALLNHMTEMDHLVPPADSTVFTEPLYVSQIYIIRFLVHYPHIAC